MWVSLHGQRHRPLTLLSYTLGQAWGSHTNFRSAPGCVGPAVPLAELSVT